MARVEKNAAGEDVRVDTPEFGCVVITETKPEPTTKPKPGAKAPADEGEE
jgi:hypothetical protein